MYYYCIIIFVFMVASLAVHNNIHIIILYCSIRFRGCNHRSAHGYCEERLVYSQIYRNIDVVITAILLIIIIL